MIPSQSIAKLKTVYNSVLDIDLLVGLLLETKNGVYAGPVAQFIIEEQFYRLKHGDRFFYSFANSGYPFTSGFYTFFVEMRNKTIYIIIFFRPNQGN